MFYLACREVTFQNDLNKWLTVGELGTRLRQQLQRSLARVLLFIAGLPMLLALIAIGVQIDLKNPDDV